MINYNDPDIFITDGTTKQILLTDGTVTVSGDTYSVTGQTVKIENDLLESESFELTQSLCSTAQLHFGSCESSSISFTIYENIATIKGKVLKLYFIPNGKASKMVQIGAFKVYEDKLSADRTKRTVTAYDAMYDIINSDVKGWYNTVLPNSSSSMTLAQFRASFLTYFGLTAESTTLANDNMTVTRTIDPDALSGAEVIQAICEINGVFGHITNEGKFRFVELSPGIDDGLFPSDTLYPADDLYPQDTNPNVDIIPKAHYTNIEFEDFNSESITGLTIRTNDDDVGTFVGTSTNMYIITGNFLVYGKTAAQLSTIATNTLTKITNRYYKPCKIECAGNPLHEVGDPLRISTTYRGVVTYILERVLHGIQSLQDTYTAKGEQKCDQQLNSVSSQVKQLSSRVAGLKVETDGIQAYVEYQLDDTQEGSYANLTKDEIDLKVTKSTMVSDLDDEMSSAITITANSITFGSSGSLIVDTTNFSLDANGNATFSGAITGSTITGSSLVSSGTNGTVTINNGFFRMTHDEGTLRWIEMNTAGNAIIVFQSPYAISVLPNVIRIYENNGDPNEKQTMITDEYFQITDGNASEHTDFVKMTKTYLRIQESQTKYAYMGSGIPSVELRNSSDFGLYRADYLKIEASQTKYAYMGSGMPSVELVNGTTHMYLNAVDGIDFMKNTGESNESKTYVRDGKLYLYNATPILSFQGTSPKIEVNNTILTPQNITINGTTYKIFAAVV